MKASAERSLSKKSRAYNTPADRAAIEDTPEVPATASIPQPEVKDPVAETKLLREMLAEQQQALRQSIRAAMESERATEEATAKLTETQDQLTLRDRELVKERLESQRVAVDTSEVIGGLRNELSAAGQAIRKLQDLREKDRRLFFRIAPGAALAIGLACFLAAYRSAPPPQPAAASLQPGVKPRRFIVPRPLEGETEAAALQRLNHVLSSYPATAIPGVLIAANRLLAEAGAPPCSMQSVDGESAVVLQAPKGSKVPLVSALARCAGAIEQVLPDK